MTPEVPSPPAADLQARRPVIFVPSALVKPSPYFSGIGGGRINRFSNQ